MTRNKLTIRLVVALATLASSVLVAGVSASATTLAPTAHGRYGRVTYPTVGRAHSRHAAASRAGTSANLVDQGGVSGVETVTGTPKVYVVFWGTQWGTENTSGTYPTFSGDTKGMAPRVLAMLSGLGTDAEQWSGVMTQYCDGAAAGTTTCAANATHIAYPSSDVLAGVWYDNSAAAPTNATGHQIAQEAVNAATYFGNTTSALNRSAQYVVVSPTGTHPDGYNTPSGNFCAYHDYSGDTTLTGGAVTSSIGYVAFTNLPYIPDMGASCGANYVNAGTAGTLDGVTIVEGHEYAETLTDMYPAGGWITSSGEETGDVCAWVGTGGTGGAQNVTMSTGSFAMQATWSNANGACEIAGPTVGLTGNNFSVSASPASGAVIQGGTATTTVSTAVTSGSAQSVALSLSGVPAGVTATLGSTSVTAGSTTSLSLSTTSTTATGTYAITVTGTGTSTTQTATYSLTVDAPSDFSLGLGASAGSVNAGSATSVGVTTAVTAGASESVALSGASTPAGVTVSFSPASVSSGSSSTMTLSTASSLTPGVYSVVVTGTAASGSHSATYSLTVNPAPANGFSMALSPTSGSARAGSSVSTTLRTTITSGSAQSVTLSASGVPSGVTVSASANPVTSGKSVTITFKVARGTASGKATITIVGTGASSSASASYTLTY